MIELRGRTVTPGFQDAHVHPVTRRPRPASASTSTTSAASTPTGPRSAPRPPPTPTPGGSPAAAGRSPTSPAASPTRRPRRHPPGPAGVPRQPRRARRVGQRRALELAGITADTPRPAPTAGSRAVPMGRRAGTLHEGAMELVARLAPPAACRRARAGPARGAAVPPLARDHGVAGRVGHPGDQAAYVALAGRGALTARVVGAMTWEAGRRGAGRAQVDELVERRAAGRWAASRRRA